MTESSAPPSATNGSDDRDPGSGSGSPVRSAVAGSPAVTTGGDRTPTVADDPDPTGGVPVQSVGPAGSAGEHTDLRSVLEAMRAEIDTAPCPECDAPAEAASEGSCERCGTRRPALRDHVEFRLGPAAALTDRGLRRRRNEDACALGRIATGAGDVLVASVCDGVASARRGDEASLAAAEAAVAAVLTRIVARGHGGLDELAAAAAGAAAEAAAGLVRSGDPHDPPATTFTAAVTRGGSAVVTWVGDSRIYWLAEDGTSQLISTDDSWAEEIAAAGVMTREQAHADRRAHVLTRWLGHDSPPGPARARRFRPAGPGFLMLCSDGVWNHVPDADRLAVVLMGGPAARSGPGDVLSDARALVDAALADGGFDNATVALIPLDPADGPSEWAPRDDGRDDTGPILLPLDGPFDPDESEDPTTFDPDAGRDDGGDDRGRRPDAAEPARPARAVNPAHPVDPAHPTDPTDGTDILPPDHS